MRIGATNDTHNRHRPHLRWTGADRGEEGDLALKAPMTYFGGKSKVAALVWSRFGDVPNFVEPFFGSGAVLLGRPHEAKTETVNDLDCYLSNFWRAVKSDPVAVAKFADWPVNEADILARHKWLLAQLDFRNNLRTDPHFYDAKIAGWWIYGMCGWIGQGWCSRESQQLPHLGDAGKGYNRKLSYGGNTTDQIVSYFNELSERLRKVRVACGEWHRILGDSVTIKHGLTAIFLDPPYSSAEHTVKYSADSDISDQVRKWAIENGGDPQKRIALCGYDGEHTMPDDWECIAWKTPGGYGSQGDGQGRGNANRERIWFSPYCIRPNKNPQTNLFEDGF